MSSGSDFEAEIRGQARAGAGKRKRARPTSDSDEELSDEDDWAQQAKPVGRGKGAAKGKAARKQDADDALDDDDLLDEEDKKRMEGMNELEREMLIAERRDKRQQELQRKKLLRRAGADDDEDEKRGKRTPRMKSTREVNEVKAKKSAIEDIKAARQRQTTGAKKAPIEDDEEDEDEEAGAIPGQSLEDISGMDDDDEGYGDEEEEGGGRFAPAAVDAEAMEEAGFEEVKGITVRRYKLEEWFNKPFFETTMPGCMVKVVVQDKIDPRTNRPMVDPATGRVQRRYMLAQVLGVEERKPGRYKFKDSNAYPSPYPFGQDIPGQPKPQTDKWLRIIRGSSEKLWPMSMVSNEGLTAAEFEKLRDQCNIDRVEQVKRGDVKKVLERLKAADTYTYTSADVKKIIEDKRKLGLAPINLVAERARLEQEKTAAEEVGDEARLAEIQQQLEALDAAAVRNRRRAAGPSMAQLNKKNAQLNVKATAQIEELAAGGGEGGAAATLDPFKRRATRSTIYWKTKQQSLDEAAEAEDTKANGTDNAANGPALALKKRQNSIRVEDIVDLSGLDLSVLDAPPSLPSMARKLLGAVRFGTTTSNSSNGGGGSFVPGPGGRMISLSEYKNARPPPPPAY